MTVYHIDFVGSSWEQLGQSLNVNNAGQNLGYSLNLSADGSTLAIAGFGGHVGFVKVFSLTSGEDIDATYTYLEQCKYEDVLCPSIIINPTLREITDARRLVNRIGQNRDTIWQFGGCCWCREGNLPTTGLKVDDQKSQGFSIGTISLFSGRSQGLPFEFNKHKRGISRGKAPKSVRFQQKRTHTTAKNRRDHTRSTEVWVGYIDWPRTIPLCFQHQSAMTGISTTLRGEFV